MQTAGLYDEVSRLQASLGVDTDRGLNTLAAVIGENISNQFGIGLAQMGVAALVLGQCRLMLSEGLRCGRGKLGGYRKRVPLGAFSPDRSSGRVM